MTRGLFKAGLLAIAGLAACGSASAQSPNGFASIIHMPVVVSSSTFHTTMFVHNPNLTATNVQFNYYGATGTPNAGAVNCGVTSIPARRTVQFDVATLCSLTGASSNFGNMRIYETDPAVKPIAVYTRVQAFTGNGFSIEGYPIGNISNDAGLSVVLGVQRQAAAPVYVTNCFVSSVGEAVNVDMVLKDENNVQLGTTQSYALAANEMKRLSDVFTIAGAPVGDYSNVRVEFSEGVSVGNPSFAAFCTVQNNTSFDADFRMAKTVDPDDSTRAHSVTQNKDGLGNHLAIPPGSKQVFGIYLQHPDFVSCRVFGDGAPNAELRLLDPQGSVAAGGNNINQFGEFYLGEKSTRDNGANGMWTIEVGSRDGLGLDADKFHVGCDSGNGSNEPLLLGNEPDNF